MSKAEFNPFFNREQDSNRVEMLRMPDGRQVAINIQGKGKPVLYIHGISFLLQRGECRNQTRSTIFKRTVPVTIMLLFLIFLYYVHHDEKYAAAAYMPWKVLYPHL